MSVTALERLMFSIGLMDQVSAPMRSIDRAIGSLRRSATEGFGQIAGGAVGLAATGLAITGLLQPAIALDRALGEVKSLGVADRELQRLSHTALQFSMNYGTAATEVVRSSYDIQSAIGGLGQGELARFTEASNLLAFATKASAGTITDYMGTMYGIFGQQANAMGRSNWVEQLTGQTATAVQLFKTDGARMSAAFASLGADATSAGISMDRQIAILGTLQATMSGSEAGTKYRAFLAGVGKAQASLGLSFTDSHGQMLPMLDILTQLQGKFGSTLDVAESDALKKAFGSMQAVALIKLLLKDTDGLARSMQTLGQVTGMDKARQMASAMVDPLERGAASLTALRISLGQAILPILIPMLDTLTEGAMLLTRWTQLFPNLTRAVGLGVLGITGMAGAVALLAIVSGVAKLGLVGWTAALVTFKGIVWLIQSAMLAWKGVIWLVNAALWANPVTWVIAGLTALVASVAAVIYWWDDLKAAWLELGWHDSLMTALDTLMAPFEALASLIESLPALWDQFTDNLSALDWSSLLPDISWLTDTLSFADTTPAIRPAPTVTTPAAVTTAPVLATPPAVTTVPTLATTPTLNTAPALATTPASTVPRGGLLQQINNSKTQSQQVSVGDIHINNPEPSVMESMLEWFTGQGG